MKLNSEVKNFIFLFILLCIISSFTRRFFTFFLAGELGFIELIQNILLISNIFLIIKNINIFKFTNKFRYLFLKIFLFVFILFEELSFLTEGLFKFSELNNLQNELNIHNSILLSKFLIIKFPLFGSVSSLSILLFLILLIVGFGSYLPISNDIKFLFLDKKYSLYSQLFFFNLLITKIVKFPNDRFIISPELIELSIYIVFFLDTKYKISKLKRY